LAALLEGSKILLRFKLSLEFSAEAVTENRKSFGEGSGNNRRLGLYH